MEESDTDTELVELLPRKLSTRGSSKEIKSNIETQKTINKSIKEEANIELHPSEDLEDNLYELKRNKWRTVVINVGGVCYRSKISNFSKYPASRLGKIFRAKSTSEILEQCDGYKPGNPPVIFFDRNDQNFTAIIDSYRMGELHVCAQNCSLVTQVQYRVGNGYFRNDSQLEG